MFELITSGHKETSIPLRSLINLCTEDTRVYGGTSTNENDRSLLADLSFDRDLTAQFGKTFFFNIKWSQVKLVTFNHP